MTSPDRHNLETGDTLYTAFVNLCFNKNLKSTHVLSFLTLLRFCYSCSFLIALLHDCVPPSLRCSQRACVRACSLGGCTLSSCENQPCRAKAGGSGRHNGSAGFRLFVHKNGACVSSGPPGLILYQLTPTPRPHTHSSEEEAYS